MVNRSFPCIEYLYICNRCQKRMSNCNMKCIIRISTHPEELSDTICISSRNKICLSKRALSFYIIFLFLIRNMSPYFRRHFAGSDIYPMPHTEVHTVRANSLRNQVQATLRFRRLSSQHSCASKRPAHSFLCLQGRL